MIKIDKDKFEWDRLEYLYETEIRYAERSKKRKVFSLVEKIASEINWFIDEIRPTAVANRMIGQRIIHRFLLEISLLDSLERANTDQIRDYLFSEDLEKNIRTFWKCVSYVWTEELHNRGIISNSEITDQHCTKISQWSFGKDFSPPQKFPADQLVEMIQEIITRDNMVLFEGIDEDVLQEVQSFVAGNDAEAFLAEIEAVHAINLRDIHFLFETSLTAQTIRGQSPTDALGILAKIFNYDWLNDKPRHDILTAMHVEVCPYCNRQYITTYDDGQKQTTADLDHYYCKAKHPYLALSLYNFVPSCQICNSRFKLSQDFFANKHVYPYQRGFGTDAVFSVTNLMALIDITKVKDEKLFELANVSADEAIQRSMDTFRLDAIYQAHTDYVKELIKKSHEYVACSDFLMESFPRLFASKDDILTSFFGIYLKPEDQQMRPLAKLTQDILKDLDVLK